MSKKIYISASDQVKNAYAAGNTNEAVQCRQIGKYLVEALKRCGFESKINLTATMAQRVTESDTWGADLHICVHTNGFNKKVTGTRLMSYDLKGEVYKACKVITVHCQALRRIILSHFSCIVLIQLRHIILNRKLLLDF